MSGPLRLALAALGVLQILGVAACALLAIWDGDDRWASTAFLLLITGFVSLGAATYPGMS